MNSKYKVAGYVKLAKLWERSKDSVIDYHNSYYAEKYANIESDLMGVYIDITGNKEIYKRREMVALIRDCVNGKINVIDAQTRAYLAANTEELCYFIYFLVCSTDSIDIITDDDDMRIDTILNVDNQKKSLIEMAKKYVAIDKKEYAVWCEKLLKAMKELE